MDEAKPQKRKPGRPRLGDEEAQRIALSFRVTAGFHQKLKEASTKTGRSISEIIERRVEQSFQVEQEFGEGIRLRFLRTVANAIHMAAYMMGDGMDDASELAKDNDVVRQAMRSAVLDLVDKYLPVAHGKNLLTELDIKDAGAVGRRIAEIETEWDKAEDGAKTAADMQAAEEAEHASESRDAGLIRQIEEMGPEEPTDSTSPEK